MKMNNLFLEILKKFNYTHLLLLVLGVVVGYFNDSIQEQLKNISNPNEEKA